MRLGKERALLVPGLLACGESGQPSVPFSGPERRGLRAHPAKRGSAEVRARSAVRCAECHEDYAKGWRESAHASAAKSPYYLALGGDRDGRCSACHTPLRAEVGADDPIHAEGVTCDACHTVTEVGPGGKPGDAGLTFDLAANRKFGPLCDAKDNYFHRVGCSPLFAESRFCAGCHSLQWPVGEGPPLPVITDFAEWSKNEQRGTTTCQECHMSGGSGEVSRGWDERDTLSRHDLFGAEDELLREGLSLEAAVVVDGGEGQSLDLTIANRGAAHSIPAGLAGRRLVLSADFVDAEGRRVGGGERIYARILVDAAGDEVVFTQATSAGEDTRLGPGERRIERFEVPRGAARAEVRVRRYELAPAVATGLGMEPPAGSLVLHEDVALGASRR